MSRLALEMVLRSAWAMDEPALCRLVEIADRRHDLSPQALEAYKADNLDKAERAKLRDGVAILYVEGPLFKRANLMTELCGATSYDVLMRDLATAVGDGNVRAIMLAIDSPGGEAAGCAEFASAVAAARGRKPIVAYAGDVAASAAYWIASAADRIVIGKSAAVGSIGVRCSISDTSDRDARAGVRRFEFVSSQSPFKVNDPKTEDGNARIKARVDALAQVFVEAVAENRGVTPAQVLDGFGKGDVLIGAAAVTAGMADDIGTFESVLAGLTAGRLAALPRRSPLTPTPRPVPAATHPEAQPAMSATPAPARPVSPRPVVPPAPHPGPSAAELARIEGERAVAFILNASAPPTLTESSPARGDANPAAVMLLDATRPNGPRTSGERPSEEAAISMMLEAYRTAEPGVGGTAADDERAARMIVDAWRESAA